MTTDIPEYKLIEIYSDLVAFYEENKTVEWLAFDTEFVGEKRYTTLLCLIQVATEHGYYLIDTLKLDRLDPFLKLIKDEKIVKITHAGDNDYRLLNILYGTIPKNIFDAQLAAGFVGYKYPISFRKLVENELNIRLSKGYAVADWESRPFQNRQLKYALNDVVPLYQIWQQLTAKLERRNRSSWAQDEFSKLERPAYYNRDPYREALNSNMIKALSTKEQVFLVRLYEWRRSLAEEKNYSKEMILPGKMIGQIVRSIRSGKHALQQNRRIPDKLAARHGDTFVEMYKREISTEERAVLKRIPRHNVEENPYKQLVLEMLNLLIRYKCLNNNVSPSLVMPRSLLKQLQVDEKLEASELNEGWRREFLGKELVSWIENHERLEIVMEDGKVEMKFKKELVKKGGDS